MCRTPSTRACETRLVLLVLTLVLVVSAAAGCARSSKAAYGEEVALGESSFSFGQTHDNYDLFREYHLAPGDVVDVLYNLRHDVDTQPARIAVNHEVTVRFVDVPELTETQRVRPDGTISLPYLGEMKVVGMTVADLTRELDGRYMHVAQQPVRISVDDVLTVKFVEAKDLNETQPVRADGTISLPHLGMVKVVGMTVEELTTQLETGYGQLLRNPDLYVLVSEPRTTFGEVRKRLQRPNLHVVVGGFMDAALEFRADQSTGDRGFSRLVKVRPDGMATFAGIGEVPVGRKTLAQVSAELGDRYKEYMPGLGVNLSLEEHGGSQVYVLGNVSKPGAYPVLKPTPVMNALALAGGFMPDSGIDEVIVFRRKGNQMVSTKIDVGGALAMESGAKVFYVQPDDVIYVPKEQSVAEVMRDVASVIMFRGTGLTFSPLAGP